MDHLYFIQMDETGYIKIGRSKNPQQRLKTLQTGCPKRLRLILVLERNGHREAEFHQLLGRWRTLGEWFDPMCVGSLPLEITEAIPWGALDFWWEK